MKTNTNPTTNDQSKPRICRLCTERESSQVHQDINPKAVRGPWDIPHHKFEG